MIASRIYLGLWSAVLQWGRFGISALVFLIVIRWLSLAEIGAFAIAAAPLRFLQVVHRAGIADAAIIAQNGDAQDRDTTALFALSLLAALALALTLLLGAGLARPYSSADIPIAAMIAALALVPLLNGIAAVPEGLLRARLKIKALAIRTVALQTVAAAVTFWAAKQGAGPWSLVLFLLVNAALGAVTAAFMAGWVPRIWPRRADLGRMVPVFLKLSGQALLANALQPALQLGVGIWLGVVDAGSFQIALRFLALLDAVAVAPLRFLALPLLAARAKTPDQIGPAVLQGLRLNGLVVCVVYLGAAAVAPDILSVFVGVDHAGTTAPLLQLFCLFGLAQAVTMVPMQALIATRQVRWVLWRNLAMLVLTGVLAWPALAHSATATAASAAAAALIMATVVFLVVPARVGIQVPQATRLLLGPVLSGLIMSVLVHFAAISPPMASLPDGYRLFLLIVLGLGLYVAIYRLVSPAGISDLRRALLNPGPSR